MGISSNVLSAVGYISCIAIPYVSYMTTNVEIPLHPTEWV